MKQIYLDNAATTKMDKRVAKEMSKWMGKDYGNASSSHFFGIKANLAVRVARSNISTYLGAPEDRIFFTSGATESNNWVIQSLVYNELQKPEESRKDEIVVSAMEHNSVLQVCKFFIAHLKGSLQWLVSDLLVLKLLLLTAAECFVRQDLLFLLHNPHL